MTRLFPISMAVFWGNGSLLQAQYPFNTGGQQGTFINPLGAQPQGPVTTNIGFANQPTNLGTSLGTSLGSSFVGGVNPQSGFGTGFNSGFGTGFNGGFGAGQGFGPYSAAFLGMKGFGAGAAFNPALLALAGKTLGIGPGLLPQEKEGRKIVMQAFFRQLWVLFVAVLFSPVCVHPVCERMETSH